MSPRGLLLAAVIVASTFVAYIPAMRGSYVWDDDFYVYQNRLLVEPGGLRKIWGSAYSLWASRRNQTTASSGAESSEDGLHTPQYYPLVFTTFWIEARLWGVGNPAGFHAVNVALHALAAVLVWRLLLRLGLPGAWFAGAVFALHPVHVESVAWITERKNVLSGVFYLAAFLSYLRFEGGRSWRWYAAAIVLYVMALLSKTVTCSLPVAILLVAWLRRRRIGVTEIVYLVPMFALGVAAGMLTAWYEKVYVGAAGTEWGLSVGQRAILAARALWFYAGKLLWPAKLIFIYPRWQLDASSVAQWLWVVAAVGVVVAAWLLRRRLGRGPLVAVLFFATALVPALGFIDVYPMRYSFVADHFQYLASLGIIALVVCGFAWLVGARRQVVLPAVGVPVLLVLGALTWRQGYMYRDQETLWRETIRRNDRAWMAHNNLGVILARRGELDAAIDHYRKSLEIEPDNAEALFNLGRVLIDDGQLDEAVRQLRRAVEVLPPNPAAHTELGRAYALAGDDRNAYVRFSKALEIDESYPEAHINLATTLARRGETDAAIRHLRRAIELRPRDPLAYDNLAYILLGVRRYAEAAEVLRAGLRHNSDNVKMEIRLSWLLATSPSAQDRDGARAVALAESACRATDFRNPLALDSLAAAYAETGQFDSAVQRATMAVQAAVQTGRSELAREIAERERSYRLGKPYRLPE